LEFLLHEGAHWIVLGNLVRTVPRRLSQEITSVMARIPAVSSDSLEIDTSFVTFLAGYQLGMWTDPSPIARSCRRNLKGPAALGNDSEILKEFQTRWERYGSRVDLERLARSLALWFHPRAKLLPPTGIRFGV
jgi:hypothetical protein